MSLTALLLALAIGFTTVSPSSQEHERLDVVACLERARQGAVRDARLCYEEAAMRLEREGRDDDVDTLRALERELATRGEAPAKEDAVALYFQTGRAELLGVSALFGGAMGGFASTTTQTFDPPLPVLLPLVGLGLGAAAGIGLTFGLPQLTPGDIHLLRASLILGTFHGVVTGVGVGTSPGPLAGLLAVGTSLATGGAGAAVVALTDLPEGGPSFALSMGALGATIASLSLAATRASDQAVTLSVLVAAVDVPFVATLALSPWIPVSRMETWCFDGGAIAGGLLGTAIALGARAPNPLVGYGSIGLGAVLGGALGLTAAKLAPKLVDTLPLPELLSVAPWVLPGRTDASPAVVGLALGGPLQF